MKQSVAQSLKCFTHVAMNSTDGGFGTEVNCTSSGSLNGVANFKCSKVTTSIYTSFRHEKRPQNFSTYRK